MRLVRYIYPTARSLVPAYGTAFRNPWSGLESEIGRLFEGTLGEAAGAASPDGFPVEFYEDKDNTCVRAELPGVNKADINVEIVEDVLAITATRQNKTGESTETFSLGRTVRLPGAVQADKVAAAYENGVLTVTLPKREEAKPRKIAVS